MLDSTESSIAFEYLYAIQQMEPDDDIQPLPEMTPEQLESEIDKENRHLHFLSFDNPAAMARQGRILGGALGLGEVVGVAKSFGDFSPETGIALGCGIVASLVLGAYMKWSERHRFPNNLNIQRSATKLGQLCAQRTVSAEDQLDLI